MSVRFDLELAHHQYWPLLTEGFSALLEKYPHASLQRVYIGKPRRPRDLSMGYYNDGLIWLNGYWFSRPPEFLAAAAKTPPAFHGKMVEEPQHVITHEFAHALQFGLDAEGIEKRAQECWMASTAAPQQAPADYALVNATEYFAELFACVELGLGTTDHAKQLRYCLDGR